MKIRTSALIACLLSLVLASGASVPAEQRDSPAAARWVGTWAASPQLTEEANLPPAPGFADSTLRQIVHVSIGGKRLRVRFSNAFGRAALTLLSAHIARPAGGSAIQPDTDRALTFRGRPSVTIPEGAMIVSDPLDFDLPALSDLAVTIHVRGAPADVTGHPGSRTTSYLRAGDAVSAPELADAARVDHWYFINGVDVLTDSSAGAIVVLGDSITDGRGSTTNGNDRWPDNLARRLQSGKGRSGVAVLNHGIGGNRLLRDGLGPNALARFDRDVLAQPGVRWLIVLEGINDIGTASGARAKGEPAATADDIIRAYEQMIERAHAQGIRVYGATIMPFEGFSYSNYYTPEGEADRQRVNDWIRTSGRFDAVIDLDAATRDPERPSRLSAAVDGGDHLHPSAAGYRIMADAIDLALFATPPGAAGPQSVDPTVVAQPDPYVARPRVVVMTDIANEPDDQMSLVRFLLYSNQFDVEGLVASTSTWMKAQVRPDVILSVLDAYEQAQPNLLKHAPGFPTAAALRRVVAAGQPGYGMDAVGPGKASPGADLILRAAERADARPLWILAWGGANTLAQALVSAGATRTPDEIALIVSRLRVYAISDQDDAGPWLRREFPGLRYVVSPSTQDGEEYYAATWTGISGDRYYRNAPGADFTTFSDDWVNANIRNKKPLGPLYLQPCCIHEGDTPSFLGLVDNGLASAMSPAFGGWGGRYVWRRPSGESRSIWTQGGDSFPGRDSSRDTVRGSDGQSYTSDQGTIWRWRQAFQHDFAARMDWTIKDAAEANHNPRVVVNGRPGTEPLVLDAQIGAPVILDATGTADPDGHALTYTWFFYPEAGSGIPGQPVAVRGPRGISPRVAIDNANAPRATVVPKAAGIAHVILTVEDNGTPSLTSYRRVILRMK